MPPRTDFAAITCSISRAFALLGESWVPLILRDVYCGIVRFDDLHLDLGVARSVLSRRLATLVDAGVLHRDRYSDTHPRDEYRLTDMGRDLVPALMAVMAWGDRWLDGGAGPPMQLRHRSCGHDTVAIVACAVCGEQMPAEDVEVRTGPAGRRGVGTMLIGDAVSGSAG